VIKNKYGNRLDDEDPKAASLQVATLHKRPYVGIWWQWNSGKLHRSK